MKKINTIILTAVAGMIMVSCNSYLDEDNLSNINSDEYFQESDGFESLVNGAYASLRTMWKGEPWLFNLGVDIFTRGESRLIGGSYENRDVYSSELNEYATLDPQNGDVSSFYTNAYYGIQVCNSAVSKAASVSGLSETTVKQRLAEVRFLRAYYYYLLAEQFGDVALVTDEIKTPVTNFTRTPEKKVYDYIISELKDVVNVLPATQSDFGRITQGAAKNLLGLVYLTRGYKTYGEKTDFSTAATLFDEVINSGQYALQPTFADVYSPDNQKNSEIIFSVQYDASSLGTRYGGNSQMYSYGWILQDKISSGFHAYSEEYGYHDPQFTPTQFLYSLYDTNLDSRYDVTFKSDFYATDDVSSIGLKAGDLRVHFPKYDQPMTTADSIAFMQKHPNCIIVPREQWKQDIEKVGGSGIFPMIWKFRDPTADVCGDTRQCTDTRDIVIFRLADTYLLAAEANLKAGNLDKATQYVNIVRRRAAISGHESEMEVSSSDVNIDFILDEKAREEAGEYNRWMDLKRTGKLIERTLKYNNLAARANSMDSHILVRPIPQSVIDQTTGGDFQQNEGY
jgi:hypothetical protein